MLEVMKRVMWSLNLKFNKNKTSGTDPERDREIKYRSIKFLPACFLKKLRGELIDTLETQA